MTTRCRDINADLGRGIGVNPAGRFGRVDTREKDGVFAEFLQRNGLGIGETVTTTSKGRRFLNREENGPWVYGLAGHALS